MGHNARDDENIFPIDNAVLQLQRNKKRGVVLARIMKLGSVEKSKVSELSWGQKNNGQPTN